MTCNCDQNWQNDSLIRLFDCTLFCHRFKTCDFLQNLSSSQIIAISIRKVIGTDLNNGATVAASIRILWKVDFSSVFFPKDVEDSVLVFVQLVVYQGNGYFFDVVFLPNNSFNVYGLLVMFFKKGSRCLRNTLVREVRERKYSVSFFLSNDFSFILLDVFLLESCGVRDKVFFVTCPSDMKLEEVP